METKFIDLTNIKGQQRIVEEKIEMAANIIRTGGLLAIPTETVYGLGANALDPEAVRRIFEAKGRPQDNPLIIHVPSAQWLPRFCEDVPPLAYTLARNFWPGPLTMILKRKSIVPDVTTAGLDSVGVRCPAHAVTQAIIRYAGVPIAAPSANTSGRPSCTTAEDVMEDMSGKIEGIVDGGPCTVGVESTIVDLTVMPPRLLRPGGLPLEDLQRVLGEIDVDKAVTAPLEEGEQPKAPGMKYRHYAPKAPVTVFTGNPRRTAQTMVQRMTAGSGVICFDEFESLFQGHETHLLGPVNDKEVQAQRVFDVLRTFDESSVTEILAQCPDNRGLGLAIGNRLKKAAGFHVVEVEEESIVLGLTGGTGAGKTSALKAIEDLGGLALDCDAVYYELLNTDAGLRAAIAEAFGAEVFNSNGTLNRKALGELVFGDSDRLDQLNDIVFRFLRPELERRIAAFQGKLCALDAVNLFESGIDKLCDCTVAVTSPIEMRVRRIMERDGIDEKYARLRVSAQQQDDYYRDKCDRELSNTVDTPKAFRETAKEFFDRLIGQIKEDKANGRR
ncbi:L-threonylcarbamoyladenylate synthase [Oscillibacter valericigenes]|jgi:L-threonylcarbamoyladenylate synthase|uniref:L-threonylcarbamoyladenylate synthase n=1 Tax=Oscillibacter ruminantium TaxID=1263547 RepID=UPI0003025340|nr:L-threonylcarbamoyladenylate synthase [Oscillibacter ruminantium]MDN0032369.1 L-threonylcarbamoyladenylate synthase [Oscillibacter valericigenes]